jgi:hypothetical protein
MLAISLHRHSSTILVSSKKNTRFVARSLQFLRAPHHARFMTMRVPPMASSHAEELPEYAAPVDCLHHQVAPQ